MQKSLFHHDSPHARLRGLPLGSVTWTAGFWAERLKLCHETIVPSMREALEDPGNKARLKYFRIAAGLEEGKHEGTFWSDGDCYKWLETVAHVYGVSKDAELDRQMDEVIEWIAAAQAPDGYLCTQIQLDAEKERWQSLRYHELYNMGHCFTAASVHREATGKDSFLKVAVKLADYLYGVFHARPKELAHFGFNPSNIMGLVDLYRTTGTEKYLELAGIFVDLRGSQPGGTDQNQDHVALRDETEAVGHAVTATYLWAGAADVYAETGEKALWQGLQRIWQDVLSTKLYVTGAVGAHHVSASIRRDPVHETFGLPHELPNATGYNETCSNIGNGMWARRMLAATGDARYADVMEQVVYTSGLSGISIDGKSFCYTNPLRWYGPEHRLLSQDAHERWFTFRCYCCPPSVARMIARMHRWAYSLSDEGVWVHLYGGSLLETKLNGGPLVLVQESEYPWSGEITIRIEQAPAEPFALMLRIPGWSRDVDLKVNGSAVSATPGAYARIERNWAAGDVVEISLEMAVRLVKANPKLEQTRNQVAVVRGPVVYCLEENDLSGGGPLAEVHLPRGISLEARHDPELLGGVTVLEGRALRVKEPEWGAVLYREAGGEGREPVDISLVPYYAWHNRGNGQMAVWLPLID